LRDIIQEISSVNKIVIATFEDGTRIFYQEDLIAFLPYLNPAYDVIIPDDFDFV